MALNAEQLAPPKFVADGHTIFMTGQAGVGKSRLVTSILSDCKSWNMKVAVVCSSGIACTVYGRGIASAVHSFYGLGTAELPANMILERSTGIVSLVNKIQSVDVIIWDEASMSSSRILELVNLLHHSLAVDPNKMKPFAGKQIVLVGEFLQLRPVPNRFDEGSFMFNSMLLVLQFLIAFN